MSSTIYGTPQGTNSYSASNGLFSNHAAAGCIYEVVTNLGSGQIQYIVEFFLFHNLWTSMLQHTIILCICYAALQNFNSQVLVSLCIGVLVFLKCNSSAQPA